MKCMQHLEGVERQVIDVLHRTLAPTVGFDDLLDYVKFDIDPTAYSDVNVFKKDYAFISFLRKWKGFKDDRINPSKTAITTWLEAEKLCFSTNRRLESEASSGIYSLAPNIISDAQRKIAQILGPLNIDRIATLCRFGNGATYDLRRGSTHADKSLKPSITIRAIPWVCQVLKGDDYLGELVGGFNDLKVVDCNRMGMVPKTVKTHRITAAEPTLNGFVQQGVGRYIRSRLKRFGIDLDDQTINQDLARRAQSESLATIDLRSASDTICANLVKLLLPREWFELLDDLRCSVSEYLGGRFRVSKFSSMGNAFTFELESLIFYALVSSTTHHGVNAVYGDDIVVHQEDFAQVVETLTWAGFLINGNKSFSAGSHFYESCGKHYFDGVEVTPCYQKDVCTRPHDFVRLHNRLVRAGIRLDLRDEFQAAAAVVRDESRRLFGKKSPGVGPLVEYDEYFVREDFHWGDPFTDRVRVRSCITLSVTRKCDENWQNMAYVGRKLRCPGFLNPDPKGQCSEGSGSKLFVTEKYHWRSATVT